MLVVSNSKEPTVHTHRGVTSNLIYPNHSTEFLTNNYYSNFTPMELEDTEHPDIRISLSSGRQKVSS